VQPNNILIFFIFKPPTGIQDFHLQSSQARNAEFEMHCKLSTAEIRHLFTCWMSCHRRPGVAMTISGHLRSSRVCFCIDMPPTTTQHCVTCHTSSLGGLVV